MNLKDEFFDAFKIILDPEKYCCICFKDLHILQKKRNKLQSTNVSENWFDLSLIDIQRSFFINDYIPNNLLVKSCCNIHYICIECLRKTVNNYENHPINESNSHIFCPYPFKDCLTKIGFKNIFEHHLIEKICTTNDEWLGYSDHANKYAFPGFTIIKCPMYKCNTDILIEIEEIKNTSIGDLIIKCSQNPKCLKKFCYYCKQYISYYTNSCYDCKTFYENENPNVYNYYINKIIHDSPLEQLKEETKEETIEEIIEETEISNFSFTEGSNNGSIESIKNKLNYKESSYLYLNKEITIDIVLDQIKSLLNEVSSYMICCICRRSLYKTEKCNGLSHHNLERCYACGRIGFTVKGLIEHWNSNGISGCFRFDTDNYIKKTIPEYICNDLICSNHEIGDCKISEHSEGIYKLEKMRIKSYIYHIIKSLLPELSLKVYDILHEMYKDDDKIYELLPYKQTLLILQNCKQRYKDFSEEIVYSELKCKNPKEIDDFYINKSYTLKVDEYITNYLIKSNCNANNNQENTPLLISDLVDTLDTTDAVDIDITDSIINLYEQDNYDIVSRQITQDIRSENVMNLLNFSPLYNDQSYYIPILPYRSTSPTLEVPDYTDTIIDSIINLYNDYNDYNYSNDHSDSDSN